MNQQSDTAVLHIHGTAGDFYTHKFIETEGKALQKLDISFLTANNRGHDVYADIRKHSKNIVEWISIGGGFEKFEDSVLDIQAWINFLVKQKIKRIILQGHSLGAQKILYSQHKLKNLKIIGQIHLSPQNDAGYMLVKYGEKKYIQINETIKKLIREGKSRDLLPQKLSIICPMSAITYSGYLTENGAGTLHPYHNPHSKNWRIFEQIQEPLLVVFGEKDTFIKNSCKTKSIKEIVNILRSKKPKDVTIKVIKGANHSYIGSENHLVETIIQWLDKIRNESFR
ncbi:hypothetical protein A2334_02905 [Candidatus Roizmanbacteria bacterium RIFOXYB2_FULL_38_10]|uniref:Serine aminopeptidase S33 domain-containing protein n=1 Tax=Candidatus Roizmanbacteria bacterium RIFOXYD1_FULL_38_12 TaxID=1802093 RepID=A0A1F7L0A2_9BACT|nr:MAG: hypothetical protein A3K47_02095 [Candidatus Roizmanbacteria bacterium RIFOXYA2_FULL_38_14]OGK63569.1 MAG: hypothetical protein A3K27_02095 [Candidatus Roizmanbacteria bacterium RIFOXYA1_FULL_37_12]OGK65415.1 MAG: hypothetical protein A3K38_02095 [Candidatus Roizmanbacteria bacterium RIFOXYB1_FULL_40_23]OGK69108.1 MAG: hypothetical protein A2334_02905 [Candidatus Roizmanbacteria bacterium RIFOXYB2_FULL_38_10]OGK69820.1 MAG: hypothetical protein A3K21_02100 [Candidatus Roizmanbacteria ba